MYIYVHMYLPSLLFVAHITFYREEERFPRIIQALPLDQKYDKIHTLKIKEGK